MTEIPHAAIRAAAEVMFRQYEGQYHAGNLTWEDFSHDAAQILDAAAPHIAAAERESCVAEIFAYAREKLAPAAGAAYRDAARLLTRTGDPGEARP